MFKRLGLVMFLLFTTATAGCGGVEKTPAVSIAADTCTAGVTVARSTSYDVTPWAITDILPGGRNAPFTGVPVPSFMGADSVDAMLEDFTISKLGVPVKVRLELVLLNERNIEPMMVNGKPYDFTFTLNPKKKSLATMTVVQTSTDDHGPAPEGVFTRETTIELLATMHPLDGGPDVTTEGTVFITTPVPLAFSFDPSPELMLKSGPVGDPTANSHTNKGPCQKDFYGFSGMLQVPFGGRAQFDSGGARAARGGSVKGLTHLVGDYAATLSTILGGTNGAARLAGVKERMRLAGLPDADTNADKTPDYFDNSLRVGAAETGNVSIKYDAATGEISIVAPTNESLAAVRINSGSGIFTGEAAANLGGVLDEDTDTTILKATPGTKFGTMTFGKVAKKGLSEKFIRADLTARVSTGPTNSFGLLNLVYAAGK